MKRILQTQLISIPMDDNPSVDYPSLDGLINETIIQINKEDELALVDVVKDIKLINSHQALIVYSKLLDDL